MNVNNILENIFLVFSFNAHRMSKAVMKVCLLDLSILLELELELSIKKAILGEQGTTLGKSDVHPIDIDVLVVVLFGQVLVSGRVTGT